MLTDEQLGAIRLRVVAATPGPWYGEGSEVWGDVPVDDFSWIARHYDGRTDAQAIQQAQDAAFIAHAREDIPALLAEVERLRALLPQPD